jgi:nitrogen fixation protein NifQ
MNSNAAYRGLIEASSGSAYDSFDVHVVASILAMVMADAHADGQGLCQGTGLTVGQLRVLVQLLFPGSSEILVDGNLDSTVTVDDEERALRDILYMYASSTGGLTPYLAAMIARRCKAPHHLWQDLGLRNRGELSRLMSQHFTVLTERNSGDMKWKKFLYRLVCRSEGFSLCVAPVCSDCDDFENCFGAEDGEAMLARVRNGLEASIA